MKRLWQGAFAGGLATLAAVGGITGCARPRVAAFEPLSARQVDAYVRRGREMGAFLVSLRTGDGDTPVWVNTHRQPTEYTVTLAMRAEGPLPVPVIEVRPATDAGPYLALVDSTAPQNWTAIDRARRLDLVAMGPPFYEDEPSHVVDRVTGVMSASPHVFLNVLRVDAVTFFARAARGPLWPLTRSIGAERADAVFGVPFLRGFAYVQWDFPRREMVFSARTPYAPDPDAVLAEWPVVSMAQGVEIEVHIEGRTQRALLDTAGSFAVAMELPPAPILRQVQLGDLVLRQVSTTSTEELNLGRPEVTRIGIEALAPYRITLDNRRRVLVVEAP